MSAKNIPPANSAGLSIADLFPPTSFAGTVASDSALRTEIWSELVTRDAREKNVLSKFIGGEGSGQPIVEKRDLSAGGSDKVTFTTVAPIRGQGVRAEEVLKNAVGTLDFGTFNVEVDLLRHAVAWTQVLKLMRFTGKTLDQISAEVMSEWAGRTEQDHIQACLRDSAGTTNLIAGYGSNATGLLMSEGLSTDIISEAKQALIANGGQPMNTGGDTNQEIPGYLFFAPDAVLRSLKSDPDYMEAVLYADSRGEGNKLYTGNYAKWDNNIIANHNVIIDTAKGRQGSPLAPTALHTGTTIADIEDAAGASRCVLGGDTFANFKGFDPKIPGGGGPNFTVSGGGHILVVRPNKTWDVFSYTGNAGDKLTGVALVGAATVTTANGTITNRGNSKALPKGSMIYQSNVLGTAIGYTLALAEGALYYAKGAVQNEQIYHSDDFANASNDAHLTAIGVQSIYGMAAYQDTSDRMPGFQLIECVRQIPGFVW